ncbi:MAG: hypothetical protein GWN67_06295 [Phycisphaerae bacterium]|nr:hypothetical protein [Phycisphaerae bacterium]NIR62563.1 hypothetical protein [candidate division Zixibacteria bacterium]NIP51568.1 hypothetical protein [Phycisphaerae bacterium]NIS50718.1 hypothetical protein [Phycisphaerae bacterium]NIU08478.1 hypothetical protein [Phycisphaerae bacterium]
MKTINIKSFLIGLLFGLCGLLALGAATAKKGDIGRYQIACNDIANACFVIDTATGQVWRKASGSSARNFASPEEWKK